MKSKKINYLRNNWDMYMLLLPGFIVLVLFKYIPLFGNIIAFQDFMVFGRDTFVESIFKSPFVGLKHFKRIFSDPNSLNAIKNTFIIAGLKMLIVFPMPIIISLLINELRSPGFKKTIQTIVYFPNFLSWVVVGSLFVQILQSNGLLNEMLGIPEEMRKSFLTNPKYFRTILIVTDMWKTTGFSTIIYLSAITAIDSEQYEAGIVDGCNRFQKLWYITIPSIASTIAMVFVLTVGQQIANGSFEQILVLSNPTVYSTGDVLQYFSYRKGLGSMEYSFSTAAGMLNSLCGLIMIYVSNFLCKKFFDKSIW